MVFTMTNRLKNCGDISMSPLLHQKINIYGRVQGVGFRPLVCLIAKKLGIKGTVRNRGGYVSIDAWGKKSALESLLSELKSAPAPVRITAAEIVSEQLIEQGCEGDISPAGGKEAVAKDVADSIGDKDAVAKDVAYPDNIIPRDFVAIYSDGEAKSPFFPADIAICPECLKEMQDAKNRRYGYPFISCTACGPRYTIIEKLPYDRERTTMKEMPLCPSCRKEYETDADRRCHGETISCHHCGPALLVKVRRNAWAEADVKRAEQATEHFAHQADAKRTDQAENFVENLWELSCHDSEEKTALGIEAAEKLLAAGKIIMVKSVGGYNLVCRSDDYKAVALLRRLKRRKAKPFAVMCQNVKQALKTVCVSEKEKELLESPVRPIVILERKEEAGENVPNSSVADNVAGKDGTLGVFLPPSGIYYYLTAEAPLVVTSCNISGESIIFEDKAAKEYFINHSEIAGMFYYERDILLPADDSVLRYIDGDVQLLRRTRGYMPEPLVRKFGRVAGTEENSEVSGKIEAGSKDSAAKAAKGEITDSEDVKAFNVLAVGAEMEPSFVLGTVSADAVKGQAEEEVFNKNSNKNSEENFSETVSAELQNKMPNGLQNKYSRTISFYPAQIPENPVSETARDMYKKALATWEKRLNILPDCIVCDLHPAYFSTELAENMAEKRKIPLLKLQHHFAHALSVAAETEELTPSDSFLAVCMDGTGYGTDGSVWGGEFLVCRGAEFTRFAHLKSIKMFGGDTSVKQAWKSALAYLLAAETAKEEILGAEKASDLFQEAKTFNAADKFLSISISAYEKGLNLIESSSAGRLFDAASALILEEGYNSYKAECAAALEKMAAKALKKRSSEKDYQPLFKESFYAFMEKGELIFDFSPMFHSLFRIFSTENLKKALQKDPLFVKIIGSVKAAAEYNVEDTAEDNEQIRSMQQEAALMSKDVVQQEDITKQEAALYVHESICRMIVEAAEKSGEKNVVLSGGCFNNRILLEMSLQELRKHGFKVYFNRKLPPGDGGISAGQAYYAFLLNEAANK